MKCLYHRRDLDGIMSGYIVKRHNPDCKLIPFDYGEELPDIIFEDQKNETIYVVDLSLDLDKLETILKYKKMIFIDHHSSSIQRINDISPELISNIKEKIIDTTNSACYLTYKYFNHGKECPLGIKLLDYFDRGKLELDKKILPFNYGVQSKIINDRQNVLNAIYEGNADIKDLVYVGKSIVSFLEFYIKNTLLDMLTPIKIQGYDAIALNTKGPSSYIFEKYWDHEKYPILVIYYRKNKFWYISMYTKNDDIDISQICLNIDKKSGGGHKSAGGIVIKSLPFAV